MNQYSTYMLRFHQRSRIFVTLLLVVIISVSNICFTSVFLDIESEKIELADNEIEKDIDEKEKTRDFENDSFFDSQIDNVFDLNNARSDCRFNCLKYQYFANIPTPPPDRF